MAMASDTKKPYGDVTYADPGYKEDDKKRYPLDSEEHCRAAWSYINMPKNQEGYTPEQVSLIKGKIKSAAKKFGIDISSDSSSNRSGDFAAVIETRSAKVDNVDFGQRIVTVIAVPYEQPAEIVYRQEVWNEVFTRTAFNGLETRQGRIPVNREHNTEALVGKVVESQPYHEDGLLTEIRISRTERGDETLELLSDDILSASAGFMVKDPRRDQILNRSDMTRRINRAFLDHVALVGVPAYEGAKVLALRNSDDSPEAQLSPLSTPRIDEYYSDPIFQWANSRLSD